MCNLLRRSRSCSKPSRAIGIPARKESERNFFPNRAERKGRSHTRLGAGGATLVMEGHSDGTAGPLRYIIVVWWDKDASLYGYFTCFKDTGSGCEVRGTAHWDGDRLVIESTREVQGGQAKQKETWALGDGGKTLTIQTHVTVPQGEFDVKQVFAKQ